MKEIRSCINDFEFCTPVPPNSILTPADHPSFLSPCAFSSATALASSYVVPPTMKNTTSYRGRNELHVRSYPERLAAYQQKLLVWQTQPLTLNILPENETYLWHLCRRSPILRLIYAGVVCILQATTHQGFQGVDYQRRMLCIYILHSLTLRYHHDSSTP